MHKTVSQTSMCIAHFVVPELGEYRYHILFNIHIKVQIRCGSVVKRIQNLYLLKLLYTPKRVDFVSLLDVCCCWCGGGGGAAVRLTGCLACYLQVYTPIYVCCICRLFFACILHCDNCHLSLYQTILERSDVPAFAVKSLTSSLHQSSS